MTGPARGPWTNLGRLPLRVLSIGKYALQKKVDPHHLDCQTFKVHHHSYITLQLVAHLGTFVLLALERFFPLALMVLDFGRVINLT